MMSDKEWTYATVWVAFCGAAAVVIALLLK